MISLENFYKEVQGKKERRQRILVRLLRFLYRYIVLKSYPKGNVCDFAFITICRKSDFDMVRASIWTFLKNSRLHPSEIVIVSDGSWNTDDASKYFSKFNINVKAVSWETCAKYYEHSLPSLYSWACQHIWGKKMASILYLSESRPVLFSDPDILWYNTPFSENELNSMIFKTSIDNCHSYDQDAIKDLHYEYLNEDAPINCGAVFLHGGLSTLTDEAKKCIDYEANKPGRFAEQTVFGIMNQKYQNLWSMQEVTSEVSDLLNPIWKPTIKYKRMIARHYLWRLKWIYWKDLFSEIIK